MKRDRSKWLRYQMRDFYSHLGEKDNEGLNQDSGNGRLDLKNVVDIWGKLDLKNVVDVFVN